MILLDEFVSLIVISASCLIVNSVGFPMFIGPICAGIMYHDGIIAATGGGKELPTGESTR